jgi:hypothetical protein
MFNVDEDATFGYAEFGSSTALAPYICYIGSRYMPIDIKLIPFQCQRFYFFTSCSCSVAMSHNCLMRIFPPSGFKCVQLLLDRFQCVFGSSPSFDFEFQLHLQAFYLRIVRCYCCCCCWTCCNSWRNCLMRIFPPSGFKCVQLLFDRFQCVFGSSPSFDFEFQLHLQAFYLRIVRCCCCCWTCCNSWRDCNDCCCKVELSASTPCN